MALKIAILKNYLPKCTSPYVVRSVNPETVEYDHLLDIMAAGRTTLSRTDIIATMQLYKEEVQKLLCEGKTVKTPTGSFFMNASGTMESLDDSFLPNDSDKNHEVRVRHKAEKDFENSVIAALKIEREERPDFQAPVVYSVAVAGEEGANLRSGAVVQIKGLRLRFDVKDSAQGAFFIDAAGAEVRSSLYPLVLPASVMATVPTGLAAGTYSLAFRAAVNGKEVKEALFKGLTVA
jgi:hypothetical protein